MQQELFTSRTYNPTAPAIHLGKATAEETERKPSAPPTGRAAGKKKAQRANARFDVASADVKG